VDKQRNRLVCANAMQEALVAGQQSKYSLAADVLLRAEQFILASPTAHDGYCQTLVQQLKEGQDDVRSQEQFRKNQSRLNTATLSHCQQRSTHLSPAYTTTNKRSLTTGYQSFVQTEDDHAQGKTNTRTQNVQAVPNTQAQNVQTVPTPQAQNMQIVPDTQAQNVHTVPDTQAQNMHTVPSPQAQNMHTVPDTQAQNMQTVPTPQAQNVQTVPTPQAQNMQTVPTPQAQDVQSMQIDI